MKSVWYFFVSVVLLPGLLATPSVLYAGAQAEPALCQAVAAGTHVLNKKLYADKVHGFWLGLSIANWTGLVTEMDKIGGDGPAGSWCGTCWFELPVVPVVGS